MGAVADVPPRPEVTDDGRAIVEAAFAAGVEAFARKLLNETAAAETVKGEWLQGRCRAPYVSVPEHLAQRLVNERARDAWLLTICGACGHEREKHRDYRASQARPGPCMALKGDGNCGCSEFAEPEVVRAPGNTSRTTT